MVEQCALADAGVAAKNQSPALAGKRLSQEPLERDALRTASEESWPSSRGVNVISAHRALPVISGSQGFYARPDDSHRFPGVEPRAGGECPGEGVRPQRLADLSYLLGLYLAQNRPSPYVPPPAQTIGCPDE